ncbi:uncharacterized protein N7487_009380 [Penicillium crustosum]|uniref:uncharacterized protein n=1 Tax=Penicillium crustosum TaxID=36656 RepID=UPI00238F88A1|nr:uncharacterized protein N7487_009380 [Penicillium crustosum]KAJ5395077.1 hypothetical protein N7487_009380 [Penicillium crustosum]
MISHEIPQRSTPIQCYGPSPLATTTHHAVYPFPSREPTQAPCVTAKAAGTQFSAEYQAAGDIVGCVANSPIQVTSGVHDACVLRTMSTAASVSYRSLTWSKLHNHTRTSPSATINDFILNEVSGIKQRRMYSDVAFTDANNPRCRASARENDKAAPAIIQSVPINPTSAPVDPPMALF